VAFEHFDTSRVLNVLIMISLVIFLYEIVGSYSQARLQITSCQSCDSIDKCTQGNVSPGDTSTEEQAESVIQSSASELVEQSDSKPLSGSGL
jgi:hypothetical protein